MVSKMKEVVLGVVCEIMRKNSVVKVETGIDDVFVGISDNLTLMMTERSDEGKILAIALKSDEAAVKSFFDNGIFRHQTEWLHILMDNMIAPTGLQLSSDFPLNGVYKPEEILSVLAPKKEEAKKEAEEAEQQ